MASNRRVLGGIAAIVVGMASAIAVSALAGDAIWARAVGPMLYIAPMSFVIPRALGSNGRTRDWAIGVGLSTLLFLTFHYLREYASEASAWAVLLTAGTVILVTGYRRNKRLMLDQQQASRALLIKIKPVARSRS